VKDLNKINVAELLKEDDYASQLLHQRTKYGHGKKGKSEDIMMTKVELER